MKEIIIDEITAINHKYLQADLNVRLEDLYQEYNVVELAGTPIPLAGISAQGTRYLVAWRCRPKLKREVKLDDTAEEMDARGEHDQGKEAGSSTVGKGAKAGIPKQ